MPDAKPLTPRELTAAVDAVRTAVANLAAVARDRAVDLPDFLANARTAGGGDAAARTRAVLADLRQTAGDLSGSVAQSAEAAAAAVNAAHNLACRLVHENPQRNPQDFAPAGFVCLHGAEWAVQPVDLPGGRTDFFALVPAVTDAGKEQLPGCTQADKLFRGRYHVLGPRAMAFGGSFPTFFSTAEIKTQTARLVELDARRRAEDAARQEQADEDQRRREEAARLARPLTVADLERLRAELAVREPA